MEPAALGRADQVGHGTGDHGKLLALFSLGHGSEQACRVGMQGTAEQLAHRRGLAHVTGVHDRHPVADLGNQPEVMRNEKYRGDRGPLQILDELHDLRLDGDVQVRRRFICNQEGRMTGEGDRNDNPLLHAAGELVRVPPHNVLGVGDAEASEELHDVAPDGRIDRPPVAAEQRHAPRDGRQPAPGPGPVPAAVQGLLARKGLRVLPVLQEVQLVVDPSHQRGPALQSPSLRLQEHGLEPSHGAAGRVSVHGRALALQAGEGLRDHLLHAMQAVALSHLVEDGQHGIEGGARLLEDH